MSDFDAWIKDERKDRGGHELKGERTMTRIPMSDEAVSPDDDMFDPDLDSDLEEGDYEIEYEEDYDPYTDPEDFDIVEENE